MYTIVRQLHTFTAFGALSLLTVAIGYSLYRLLKKKTFTPSSKGIFLAGLITTHVQTVVGLLLYFLSPLGLANFSSAAMKEPMSRLFLLEHPIAMLLAVVLVTIGYSKAKRQSESNHRFKAIALFFGLGLCVMLTRIPWQTWL